MPSPTRETPRRREARDEKWIDLHARWHFGVLAFLLSAGIFVVLTVGFSWVAIDALLHPEAFPEHTGALMLLASAFAAFTTYAAVSNGRDETRSNRNFRLVKARIHPRTARPGDVVRCTLRWALSEGVRLSDLRVAFLGLELERDLTPDDAIFFHTREFHRDEVVLSSAKPSADSGGELERAVEFTVPEGAVATHTKGVHSIEWDVRVQARFTDGQEWKADSEVRVVPE